MKKCKWCGKEFEPINSEQKFCSNNCSYFYHNKRYNFSSYIKTLAKKYDFKLENLDKIINAKLMLYKENIKRCPCDVDNPDRFCGSARCIADTVYQGHCHCRLFWSKKPPLIDEKREV